MRCYQDLNTTNIKDDYVYNAINQTDIKIPNFYLVDAVISRKKMK